MTTRRDDEMNARRLLALPAERAAATVGISVRQLDYWSQTGLLRPAVDERLTPRRPIRLYGFAELLALLVIAELRTRGVSVQHIRRIVDHLRQRGYERPLSQLRYATYSGGLYFQSEDGAWESGTSLDQLVIHQVIDLDVLATRIDRVARRDPETFGRTTRRRAALGSKSLVAGTRVPVATVRRYLEHGATVSEILSAYPQLVAGDIETVRRGGRRLRCGSSWITTSRVT